MNETATGPWREALGLIDTLLSEPVDAREKLLANLAASRPDLHVRVRALLDADAQATRVGFMSARRDDGLYEGEVAIKTLHPFFAHGAMRERFLREAQLLGALAIDASGNAMAIWMQDFAPVEGIRWSRFE